MPMVNSGSLLKSKIEFFVMIVKSIVKIPILDVPGVFGDIIVIIYSCLQYRCTSLIKGNF